MASFRTSTQAIKDVAERTKPSGKGREVSFAKAYSRKTDVRTILKAISCNLTPEERCIRERLENGTCHLEPLFSLKALGTPDPKYQARHQKFNAGHAARLAAMVADKKDLSAVVVFRSVARESIDGVTREVVSYILADGFHRQHAYTSLGRPSIPAYIVDVPPERLEIEAKIYASMCNQMTLLERTNEDKREAIRMACDVPEFASWTDEQVADHCGVDRRMVKPIRLEWVIANKKDLPKPKAKAKPSGPAKTSAPAKASAPVYVPLPTRKNPAPASPAPSILMPGAEDEPEGIEFPPPLHNSEGFRKWLLERGVVAKPPERSLLAGLYNIHGLLGEGLAIVLCASSDIDDFHDALGRAVLLAGAAGGDVITPTVVLNRVPQHRRAYAIASEQGFLCVSPEELAERLKDETDEG